MDFEFTGFVSMYFAIFLVGSIFIYWVFPKKIRFYTLLVFSLVFYCLISWKSIFFLIYSIVLNYFIALAISHNKKKVNAYLEANPDLEKADKKAYKATNSLWSWHLPDLKP